MAMPPEEESLRDTINRLEILVQLLYRCTQNWMPAESKFGLWVREALKGTVFTEENDAELEEFFRGHRFRHHSFRFSRDADVNSKMPGGETDEQP